MLVPDSVTVVGELEALLVTVTVPESVPEAAGAKITLNVVDCPAARETGREMPEIVKLADAAT